MPSRAYTSFLREEGFYKAIVLPCVNALSGLYLISTLYTFEGMKGARYGCQCPLGLIPHFYGTPSKT